MIGHRRIEATETLRRNLRDILERLIVREDAQTFLFGSKSEFDRLCHEIVTELKCEYPHIRRVLVRAEYEYINREYENYLLLSYEETYFPPSVSGAGALSYVKRNREMIDRCDVLVTYCNADYAPPSTYREKKSGTKIAVDYAAKKKKRIINVVNY